MIVVQCNTILITSCKSCDFSYEHPTPFTSMSISVDDLASSLSSSHIGQEAIDLAALQVLVRNTSAAAAA